MFHKLLCLWKINWTLFNWLIIYWSRQNYDGSSLHLTSTWTTGLILRLNLEIGVRGTNVTVRIVTYTQYINIITIEIEPFERFLRIIHQMFAVWGLFVHLEVQAWKLNYESFRGWGWVAFETKDVSKSIAFEHYPASPAWQIDLLQNNTSEKVCVPVFSNVNIPFITLWCQYLGLQNRGL